MNKFFGGLFLLLFAGVGVAETMGERLDALIAVEEAAMESASTTERAAAVAAAYDRLFGAVTAESLQGLTLDELRQAHRAADLAHFNTLREQDLQAMERTVAELVRRNEQTQDDVEDLYGAYVAMRAFGQASELARREQRVIPGGTPTIDSDLPDGYQGPTWLQVPATGSSLARKPFLAQGGSYVVIVSHPLCHFSRQAVAAIEQDPELSAIFRAHAHWLAPVDRRLNLAVLQAWNAAHPQSRLAIAYRRADWPMIDYWGTPTFYFYAQGKLVAKVTGWPKEGRRAELTDAAKKAGIGSASRAGSGVVLNDSPLAYRSRRPANR